MPARILAPSLQKLGLSGYMSSNNVSVHVHAFLCSHDGLSLLLLLYLYWAVIKTMNSGKLQARCTVQNEPPLQNALYYSSSIVCLGCCDRTPHRNHLGELQPGTAKTDEANSDFRQAIPSTYGNLFRLTHIRT